MENKNQAEATETVAHAFQVVHEDANFKWYMIRVATGKEAKSVENIKSELRLNKLEQYVSDIVLPKERAIIQRQGKKYNREKLTFPGYVLIQAHMIGELPRTLNRTNLVAGIVGDNNKPQALKASEVERIFGNIVSSHAVDSFLVGDSVNVMDGAFTGFKAVVNNINNDKRKLDLTIMIFGRETSMELSFDQVEKIKN